MVTKEIDRIVERGPSFLGEGPSFLADRTSGELEPVSVQWASRVSLAVDKREKEKERERERERECFTAEHSTVCSYVREGCNVDFL